MWRARTGVARYRSESGAEVTLQRQAPAVDGCRMLFVLDHSGRQASPLKPIGHCRIVDGSRKSQRDSSSGCVGRKNRTDLSEWGHLLNIRPQVIEHGMFVEQAEDASH